jgi:hypothetical protein
MGNAPHQQIPPNTGPLAIVPGLLCTLILLSLPAWRVLPAQSTPSPSSTSIPAATPTLHVYANLKQVPVLVLTQNYQRMKPIDTSRFRLSLDSGPLFRPTYVRQEGEDPISLAILIDASKPDSDALPQLAQAIGGLAPDYLKPRDHVSIYVLDCSLIRTAYDLPAESSELEQAVRKALLPGQIRRKQKKGTVAPCQPTMPLWDSMSNVLDELTPLSGRRVLLAITDGEDGGSRTLWTNVMHHAQVDAVAVFGMLPMPFIGVTAGSPLIKSTEDKFGQICSLTGGVEIQTRYAIVSWRLKEFTRIVRERYILEFPRAPNEEAGIHTLAVSYKKGDLYIVSSGITVPVASEEEKNGANTVPASPAQFPSEGARKVLLPNQ